MEISEHMDRVADTTLLVICGKKQLTSHDQLRALKKAYFVPCHSVIKVGMFR